MKYTDTTGKFKLELLTSDINFVRNIADRDIGTTFKDLDKMFNKIIKNIKMKGSFTKKHLNDLKELLSDYYSNYVIDFCDLTISTVNKIKNKTQDFSDIIIELRKIKDFATRNYINKQYFNDLIDNKFQEITYKIISRKKVVKNNRKYFIKGLIYGGIISLVLGIVCNIIL
ncbi:MAG: hypothetical protein ABIG89_03360 [Candidatus Woesearchaeota archaeon]